MGKSLLIQSNRYEEQIQEVMRALDFTWELEKLFSICLECNVPVQDRDKQKVKDRVPRNVLNEHDTFWQCPQCTKVFWQGSHYENTQKKLIMLGLGAST